MNAPLTAAQQEAAYLARLGERVRAWRVENGRTRKTLAAASGVSERYLAQLEAGEGNISVLLLRRVARAMGVPVEELIREENGSTRPERIALVGLRGAGKSTLGAKLAQALGVPFVELDREVEKEAGAKLGEVFAMYGQDAFRRFERRALERVLDQHAGAVIATGGSLVTDPATYELLLDRCFCIWLKASPEEHMARVMAQGDLRPFKGRSAALDEIRTLLAERDPLYARAALAVETSGRTVRQTLQEIRKALT
jgi:XRE family aerobic/anaerobic benzoate catabolism transcriptional regulator